MKSVLLTTQQRFNKIYGYQNKGIQTLLRIYGDPSQLLRGHIKEASIERIDNEFEKNSIMREGSQASLHDRSSNNLSPQHNRSSRQMALVPYNGAKNAKSVTRSRAI